MSAPRGSTLLAAGVAGVLLGLAWASPRQVPYDMDEFAHYQPLGCLAHPLSREHNLRRESCGAYDLRLPGTSVFLPLRSYLYIGSLPVLPYLPFWLLVRDPVSVRLQGAVFFALALYLLSLLAEARGEAVLLGSLLFPLFPFLFLQDLGPNGLTILLDLLGLLLVREALRRRAPALFALSGLVLFLGIFAKPVFALYLPALALFALREVKEGAPVPRAGSLLLFLLALGLPTSALLLARDHGGNAYFRMIGRGSLSASPGSIGEVLSSMAGYLTSASRVAPRTLTIPGNPLDILPLAFLVILVGPRVVKEGPWGRTTCFLGMAGLTFLLTLGVGAASEPHHFAFTMTPLVLALVSALAEGATPFRRLAALGCAAVLLSLAFRFPKGRVEPDTSFEKDRLLAVLRRSGLGSHSVQVHASWGTYYIAHLFGDPQEAVVALDAFGAPGGDLEEIASFARRERRDLVLVAQKDPKDAQALSPQWGRPRRSESFGEWSLTLFSPGEGGI